jgi:choice-of-anchor B domain-containing protein
VAGDAAGFPCNNIDLGYWFDIDDIGGGEGNDIWGWTDTGTGDEYAIMGRSNGTAFVDVTDPQNPIYLGNLPTHDVDEIWRDIKVHADHAFIVSESSDHGMQVFDLTQLGGVVAPPVTFVATYHDAGFGNAHNIAINEDSGYAYVVGSDQCGGGILFYDVSTPSAVAIAGCFSGDGYTHDVQCINYAGPDTDYAGAEVCFASNEDSLTIVDVTSKVTPTLISKTDYAGRAYTHHRQLRLPGQLCGWSSHTRYFIDRCRRALRSRFVRYLPKQQRAQLQRCVEQLPVLRERHRRCQQRHRVSGPPAEPPGSRLHGDAADSTNVKTAGLHRWG